MSDDLLAMQIRIEELELSMAAASDRIRDLEYELAPLRRLRDSIERSMLLGQRGLGDIDPEGK